MKIRTLGHAGMLISEGDGSPLLLTDPWLIGSTYWRSWWLQNYPTVEEFQHLQTVKYVYITHEHPDHFHPPTLRRLGRGPHYFCADLPENRIQAFLSSQGYKVEVLKPLRWRQLTDQVRMLSIPQWNDDSVLLVELPNAFVVNLNDAKPISANLKQLRKYMDKHVPDRQRILLSSYSPASIVNSFIQGSKRVSIKQKADYVRYINSICDRLHAARFIPFASQAIFLRSDSRWANAFRVTIDDLKTGWASKTELLYPYSTIDFETGEVSHVDPSAYNGSPKGQMARIEAQEELDRTAELTGADIRRLEKKMRTQWFLFALLFPRGIGFQIKERDLVYHTWKGRITSGKTGGDFTLRVPTQAIKDVLQYNHFSDLGITMFTIISLNTSISPIMVWLFFLLLKLDDYGHTAGRREFGRWLKSIFATSAWKIPAQRTPGGKK